MRAASVALRAPADAMTQWIFGYKSGVGLDYFENYRACRPVWHRRRSAPNSS